MSEAYDAILIVSFGGPEGMKDVMPFLENVLRGRNVPPERMHAVAHHYEMFGGVSPINEQNRNLIAALKIELQKNGLDLPIYWGNRNWHPMLADTIKQMEKDGIKKALAFVTSAYSSYSSCRQYRENISAAQETCKSECSGNSPQIDKLRAFYNHPGFIEANSDRLRDALDQFSQGEQNIHVAFTAHSIPTSMAENSDYESQLQETAKLVAERVGINDWELCYQSRSGPATQPWLEPDICDHIRALHKRGVKNLIIAPAGFVSDHMEIKFDLDTEAKELCDELDIKMVRAGTAGTHPAFIQMIRTLIQERLNPNLPKLALGTQGPRADECSSACCPAPIRPPVSR